MRLGTQSNDKGQHSIWEWIIPIVLFLLGFITVIYGGKLLFDTLKNYHQASVEYHELEEETVSRGTGEEPAPINISKKHNDATEQPEEHVPLVVNESALKQKNADYVAWLEFPLSNVSLPVVHENESDEYLYKTFLGGQNSSGCLFIQRYASLDFSDKNTFIYGHNMKNGSMFGMLKQLYREPPEEDVFFYLYVNGRMQTYQVFSLFIVPDDSDMYKIPATDTDYDTYIAQAKQMSHLKSNVPDECFTKRRNLVTLSTCYGSAGTDVRLLACGIRVE